MMKKLYFIETNGYNLVVSVDSENNCRYCPETEDFPYFGNMDKEEKEQAAKEFLEEIEDDNTWKDDLTPDQVFQPGDEILAEIEKEIW